MVERLLRTAGWLGIIALLGEMLTAQHPPGFEVVAAPGAWPEPELRVAESGGLVVAVEGDTLVRTGPAGERETLRCALHGGPGTIRALAKGPNGLVWIAADRGVFVTSTHTDWFDAPILHDGIPPGKPVGLLVDGRGRLWLGTDIAVGVIDTRFFFGRTFGPDDGLPPGPFTGLAAGEDGRILLRTADHRVFAYAPDRGPGPRGTVRVPGGDVEVRDVTGRLDGTAAVLVTGDAAGGATFRFRRRNHHVLYPLDDEHEISGLKPGTHGVDIVAIDRDLNLAPIASLSIRVPFPKTFDKRMLLPIAALAALLVLATFWWRGGRGREARWRAVLSAALFFIVGLQVLAGFLGYGRSWPFIGFSMYTETFHEGSILYKPKLFGIRKDGSQSEINVAWAGMPTDGYWQVLSEMVHGGVAPREQFLQAINKRRPWLRLVGFEVHDERICLTVDGPVRVPPIVMIRWVPE